MTILFLRQKDGYAPGSRVSTLSARQEAAYVASGDAVQVQGSGYIGVVASRCAVPANKAAAASQQAMSRTKHIATEDLTWLQLVYANWYGNEQLPGAAAQYTASIEYPVGTITRVTFGGSASGNVADGETLVSDRVALSTPIPRGAVFFVRTWQNAPNGIVYVVQNGLNNATGSVPNSGEWWTFGAATADLTGSTSNVNNISTTNMQRPAAIIGAATRPTFWLAGDSRLSNGAANDTVCNAYGGLGEVERSVGKAFAVINAGFPNEKYADVVAANGYTRRLALSQYCSHVISEYGINDCSAGTPAATILGYMATFAAMFGNKPFIQTTISPRSTSTDAWATTGNQTTVAAANGPRVAFNNAVRGGMAVLSGYIEVADQVESARDSGLWKAPGYTTDGTHGTTVANLAIENSLAFSNLAQFYR